jgi:hypothetical protein
MVAETRQESIQTIFGSIRQLGMYILTISADLVGKNTRGEHRERKGAHRWWSILGRKNPAAQAAG